MLISSRLLLLHAPQKYMRDLDTSRTWLQPPTTMGFQLPILMPGAVDLPDQPCLIEQERGLGCGTGSQQLAPKLPHAPQIKTLRKPGNIQLHRNEPRKHCICLCRLQATQIPISLPGAPGRHCRLCLPCRQIQSKSSQQSAARLKSCAKHEIPHA